MQANLADVAHQRNIRVVDRHGEVRLILSSGGRKSGLRLIFLERTGCASFPKLSYGRYEQYDCRQSGGAGKFRGA
jgi:hypothetical protein